MEACSPRRCWHCAAPLPPGRDDGQIHCEACARRFGPWAWQEERGELLAVAVLACDLDAPVRAQFATAELWSNRFHGALVEQASPVSVRSVPQDLVGVVAGMRNGRAVEWDAATDSGSSHVGSPGCSGGSETFYVTEVTFAPALPSGARSISFETSYPEPPIVNGAVELNGIVPVRSIEAVFGQRQTPVDASCRSCGSAGARVRHVCATCRTVRRRLDAAFLHGDPWPAAYLALARHAGPVLDGEVTFTDLWAAASFFEIGFLHTGVWSGGHYMPLWGRWSAIDDLGHEYHGFVRAGSGAEVFRGRIALVPALHEDARVLTVQPEQAVVEPPRAYPLPIERVCTG